MNILEKIEDALDKSTRPLLREHNGNIAVLDFKDGTLNLRMVGGCANCPAATTEIGELAATELKRLVPEVQTIQVHTGVSDELLASARTILARRKHERLERTIQ